MLAITRYGFIRSVQFGGTDLPCVVPDRRDDADAKADSRPVAVPRAATRPMQRGMNRRDMGTSEAGRFVELSRPSN